MRALTAFLLPLFLFQLVQAQGIVRPGDVWPDEGGHHIQAHGGGIIRIGDYYYWYGEERRQGLDTNYRYVSCYRSKDLANWKFMGDALRLSDPEHLGSHWVLERPKVYFCHKTNTYVMYFHLDDARYKFARVGVAVSRQPDGPFTYRESFRPLDKESRDIGQFIDDDGTAYLIFESRPTKGFFIARLSSDYLKVEKAVCLVDAPLEGGAVVHYKGLYYVIGSALTGWRPNPNKYAVSTSLEGPWSEFRDIAPPGTNTYGSQSTMLLKVAGTKDTAVIFMADQWKPRTQWDSRYLWMPLQIGDGKLWVPRPADWSIDIRTGEVSTLQTFQHPGLLHSMRDLERMKEDVAAGGRPAKQDGTAGAGPVKQVGTAGGRPVKQDITVMADRVYSGYKLFASDPASQADYKMQGPMKMVGRNPTFGQTVYDNDANAAYQNAVMWAITGDSSHAQTAIGIINAWSSTLKEVTGRDAVLMAGLGPFKMVNAAEIMRYTYAGWKEEDIRRTEDHFKNVIYPVIKDFAPFANGNWDAAAIKTTMAIGVFCDDRSIFERALRYYTDGWGNGSLRHYIVNEQGQLQESGRDQPHSQLGIGMLAEACAIAWNQGLDLYGYDDNRLLKGFGYTAKFNLGNDDLPFVKWLDRTGKYYHERISQQGRGQLRAVYEQVYNHYVVVRGLKAPFVQQAAEKLRPEGPGRPGADHPGYGTLFFSHPDSVGAGVPMAPAGLIATGREGGVELRWINSIHAKYYIIRRAEKLSGPYTIVARAVKGGQWTDKMTSPRRLYYYTVTAANALGSSSFALPQAAFTGLPAGWRDATIGHAHVGTVVWDGAGLTIEADGMGVDSGFHFTYLPLKEDGMLTVRLVPQPSSQFSTMGLMLRKSTDARSPFVALMIVPGKSGAIEAPEWHTELLTHSAPGAGVAIPGNSDSIGAPAVTNGRITGYYWLRLVRKGKECHGFVSYDGTDWKEAGSVGVDLAGNCLLGVAVASGMANTTVIHFDHLEAMDSVPSSVGAAVGAAGVSGAVVPSMAGAVVGDDRVSSAVVPSGVGANNLRSGVWQWSVPVRGARKEGSTAYLWVPETCRRLRGVVLAQHNMEEISILENAYFRSEMEKLSFGIVWASPFFDRLFRFNEGAGEMLDTFMSALADSSGYGELKYVPIVTMGHSAAASWPYYFSVWNPDRALCAISVSGQWPWFRDPQFAPDIWGHRTLDYIPCLETMGEYEAAGTWSKEGLKERREHPLVPLSMLACPGEGHFAASEKKIHYLSLYIKKAAQYRLPENYTGDGPAKLRPIDPLRSGWLMEKWPQGEESHTQPAPVPSYMGDTTQTFWFFDKEMAMATVDYERCTGRKRPQLLGYIEDGSAIRQRNTHLQVDIPFRPMNDGISFVLRGGFLDTVPGESERPKTWTSLPVGASIGHAQSGAISIDPVCGPVEKVNDSVFRLDLRRGEDVSQNDYKLYFVATHPGDAYYNPAVQQAEMSVPGRNAKGEPQHIDFPAIGDQESGIKKVRLRAGSDKGLPVHYYVQSGPAIVDDEDLLFTAVPPRSRLPIKITVVAWQYGRGGETPIQSAEPVRQSFYLYDRTASGGVTRASRISSPDGSTVFECGTDSGHHLLYRVLSDGREVIGWSAMGLANGKGQPVNVEQLSQSVHTETFAWPFGERDSVENNYNEAVLRCSGAGLCYQIETRVYNGAAAFRYRWVDSGSRCQFTRELTSFRLKENYTLYQYNQESVFTPTAIDTLAKTCDLPATLTNGRLFLSIGEAANDNFTKAELARGKDPHELRIVYTRDSTISGVYMTPWRSIGIAGTAVGLHAFSDLGLRLSPAPAGAYAGMASAPPALEAGLPASVRPGKLIRAQLTTQAGLDCIDFAVRHNFQYILYDAGWYGVEWRTTSDPLTPIPAIDLPRVIAYGREKGIGVILYVNYVGLREKLDKILPLYKQWGVAGLKFGFVDGLTQHGIIWLADAIRKVNDYGFVLDIHDNYKPTGLSRTYPALLTQEGVRGDENGPDAFHTTMLPYTRFLAGGADFTFCFPNAANSFSKNIKVSKAQQLALTVVYFSPLQSIFWYGRPADYRNNEEIEFFDRVPTIWDDTRYLAGDIGKNIAVARRHGDNWYVGCAAGMEDWDATLRMDFLGDGKIYRVTTYEDDGNGGIRRRVMTMRTGDPLPLHIRAKGGIAMIMTPA